jgi:hypothetical protein
VELGNHPSRCSDSLNPPHPFPTEALGFVQELLSAG